MKKILIILAILLTGCAKECTCSCTGYASFGGYTETHTEIVIVDKKKDCPEGRTDFAPGLYTICKIE